MANRVSEQTLEQVKKDLQETNASYRDLAKKYNVSKTTVSRMARELKISGVFSPRKLAVPVDTEKEAILAGKREKAVHLLLTTKLMYREIAKVVGLSEPTISIIAKETLPIEYRKERAHYNHSVPRSGEKSWLYGKRGKGTAHYKTGRVMLHGYVYVLTPSWYVKKSSKGYIPEHVAVICENLGLDKLPCGHIVHHCDEDKANNSLDNLVLMPKGVHNQLHGELRALKAKGVTTISKESTAKWLEARRRGDKQIALEDIVCSVQECTAVDSSTGVA